jgi:hypothetical protein
VGVNWPVLGRIAKSPPGLHYSKAVEVFVVEVAEDVISQFALEASPWEGAHRL